MRSRARKLLVLLCAGVFAPAWADPPTPLPPPILPPPPAESGPSGARQPWRNLSPQQRDAIRRLSQEQRWALINRAQANGAPPAPATRLSPQERRQLREQIRQEHEGRRRGGGFQRRP